MLIDAGCCSHTGPCLYTQSSRLLQRHVGVSVDVTRKLQYVLHAATRLVTSVRWDEQITQLDVTRSTARTEAHHVQDSNDGVPMRS